MSFPPAPGTGTPSGAAGGDLSGNYPDPNVAKIQGFPVSGTDPTSGQILVDVSGTWTPENAGYIAESLGLGKYVAVGANNLPTWIDPIAVDWAAVISGNLGWLQIRYSESGDKIFIQGGKGTTPNNFQLYVDDDGVQFYGLETSGGQAGFQAEDTGVNLFAYGAVGQTTPLLDLEDNNNVEILQIFPNGSIGGITPTTGGNVYWDGSKYVVLNRPVSGALPTQQFVTTNAARILTTRDVEVHTPVTFSATGIAAATCKVEISPDNTTYSTLCTVTKPIGTTSAGSIEDIVLQLPAGWYLKLTTTNATLGLSTYY